MERSEYDGYKIIPFKDSVYVRQMRTVDDWKDEPLKDWCEVMAVGPRVKDIKVGDIIVHDKSYPHIVRSRTGERDWYIITEYNIIGKLQKK